MGIKDTIVNFLKINGITHKVGKSNEVILKDQKIYSDGKVIGDLKDTHLTIEWVGDSLANLTVMNGDITCGNIAGNADAGRNLTCENIAGNADAGDDINCNGNIGGKADAGENISCGEFLRFGGDKGLHWVCTCHTCKTVHFWILKVEF